MKKIITLTLLILTFNSFSQNDSLFIYDINGLNQEYLVMTVDSTTQQEIFNNSVNWIKETYKNPDKVIKMSIENKKVRFEGSQQGLICIKALGMNTCYNALYTIEIEFKENRYKFTPLSLSYRVPPSQYNAGATVEVSFKDGSGCYKNNKSIRKVFASIPPTVENLFNSLNKSLNEYVKKESIESTDTEW